MANAAALLLVVVPLLGQTRQLFPVDDAPRDGSFRSFVGKLRSAVAERDTRALQRLVDPEVVVGPDKDDQGWAKFVERWRPDDRKDSPLWGALADMLSVGFVREHPTLFLSPYLVWRFPRELNPRTHLVVVRDKAALREEPSLRAAVGVVLSFDIVRRRVDEPEAGEGLNRWLPVRTLDGVDGWVNARDVMSPMMPRAQFGQRAGRWVMTALEGDDE